MGGGGGGVDSRQLYTVTTPKGLLHEVGSSDSRFNVLLKVMGKVTRQ